MGQLLHPRARTTPATRREIQLSKESLIKAAGRFNVNPKTIAKWRKRNHTEDQPMGPKPGYGSSLSEAEQKAIVAFRKLTQLPLDDVLYSLQETIPHLRRSTLHRCLQRHGCSKLSSTLKQPPKKAFKKYPIGYFHIDIAEVRTAEGKQYLFVAIDRTSKLCYAKLSESQCKADAAAFLSELIAHVPYKIHKILTDNGIQFTNHKHHTTAFKHIFDRVCEQHAIEHRKTQVKHPWTNGQVERMNRTLKEATVKSFFYASHEQLQKHLAAYLMAYNLAKRLKALKGRTPWQFIQAQWAKDPTVFHSETRHFFPGPYN